jgi:hypothetical protein
MGPRTGLDNAEKRKFLTLPGLELLSLGSVACSHSLYRLYYSGSCTQLVITGNYNRLTVLHTVKIAVNAAHIKSSISSLVISW